jgi:hypothetical protein
MAALDRGGLYLATRRPPAPAGVQTAADSNRSASTAGPLRVSCHCNGPDPDINWSCICRWWVSPTCGGYSETYVDGTTESDSWCY